MRRPGRGSVLLAALAACVAMVALCIGMVSRTVHDSRMVEIDRSYYQALYAAEAGADTVEQYIVDQFSQVLEFNGYALASFGWLDQLTSESWHAHCAATVLNGTIGDATYSVVVAKVENPTAPHETGVRYVTLRSTGSAEGVSKTLEISFNFALSQSRVFDYAYCIDTANWFYGSRVTVNGDVRANGDIMTWGPPTINGDLYAAVNPEDGSVGCVWGAMRNDILPNYWDDAGDRARPTNPTAPPEDTNCNGVLDPGEDDDGDGELDTFEYEPGYDGSSEEFEGIEPIDMPRLGDLSVYRGLALSNGGTVSRDGDLLIDGVYDGDGPDGRAGTADDGCIVLIGMKDEPLEINGPVFIEGDVIIRGYVTGQGTIYAGRNVHIGERITYLDPPSWPKPDTDPEATAAANAAKDMLGLAAKGNVILGDYTKDGWRDRVMPSLRPPYTHAYEVDSTEAELATTRMASPGTATGSTGTTRDGTAGTGTSTRTATARRLARSTSHRSTTRPSTTP